MNYWEFSSYIEEKHGACLHISDGVAEIEIKNHILISWESYVIQYHHNDARWWKNCICIFFFRIMTNLKLITDSCILECTYKYIILLLQSRRLQAFSRHIDLWQGWLSLLLPSRFHHTLKHVVCRQGKRCVDVQVSFCHGMVCREHIF